METNVFIVDLYPTAKGKTAAWLGGSQDNQEKWSWADKSTWGDFENWGWREPNGGSIENHMGLYWNKPGSLDGLWNDWNGLEGDGLGAVCQCDSATEGTGLDLEVLKVPEDLLLTSATEFCGKPGKK